MPPMIDMQHLCNQKKKITIADVIFSCGAHLLFSSTRLRSVRSTWRINSRQRVELLTAPSTSTKQYVRQIFAQLAHRIVGCDFLFTQAIIQQWPLLGLPRPLYFASVGLFPPAPNAASRRSNAMENCPPALLVKNMGEVPNARAQMTNLPKERSVAMLPR
jgi:hypothetical protein